MQGCYYALSTRTTTLSDIAKLAAMLPPAVLYLSGELEPLPGAMSYKINTSNQGVMWLLHASQR